MNFIVPNLYVDADSRPKLTIAIRGKQTGKTIRDWFLPGVDKNMAEYCSFEDYCAVLRQDSC